MPTGKADARKRGAAVLAKLAAFFQASVAAWALHPGPPLPGVSLAYCSARWVMRHGQHLRCLLSRVLAVMQHTAIDVSCWHSFSVRIVRNPCPVTVLILPAATLLVSLEELPTHTTPYRLLASCYAHILRHTVRFRGSRRRARACSALLLLTPSRHQAPRQVAVQQLA